MSTPEQNTPETQAAAVNETDAAAVNETQLPAGAGTPPAPETVSIAAAAHEEAQGIFASLRAKLENFEHALAADAKAELEKLKALLHL